MVAAAESYAFDHLASYPDHTEIVVYPASMVGVLGPQIDELLDTMDAAMATQGGGQDAAGQEMMRMYAKALVGAIGQTQRAVFSLSQGQSSIDLHAHLYPVADSTLAAFTSAQVPADHALLQKLPATVPQTMVMSGEMRAGAARDVLLAFSLETMGSMYGGETTTQEWLAIIDAWLATVDGEFAAAVEFNFAGKPDTPGMRMQSLFGVTDASAMFSAWRAMLETMVQAPAGADRGPVMGMNVDLSYDRDVLVHEGVSVDRYTTKIDLESMPEAQREAIERMGTAEQSMHLSAFDSFGALVSAGDDHQAMTGLIDAARGKAPTFQPAPGLSTSLATSTARGESFLFYIDVSAVAPPDAKIPFANVTMAMGKHENALTLRLSAS